MDGLASQSFSLEFFPPKTPQAAKQLSDTLAALAPLGPDFVSVTFGAGGTTRDGTYQTVCMIRDTLKLRVFPHISCMGVEKPEILDLLAVYRNLGINRLVALRGDLPRPGEPAKPQAFQYANELVAFIKEQGGFHLTVGCYPEFHPEAPDYATDIANFVRKVKAGADEAITQYFFNNEAFYTFRDSVRRAGVDIPIYPGIMPIVHFDQIERFSRYCGADIPVWIRKRMQHLAGDPEGQKSLGVEIAIRQAEDLLRNGVPGLHFYTLNRADSIRRVWGHLGIGRPSGTPNSTTVCARP